MKIKLLAISALLPFYVFASDSNTVTFYGEVTDSTCSVNIDGSSGNVMVQLDTVLASALSVAGKSTGEKEFTFNVTGCTSETKKSVGMRLIPYSVDGDGNLQNIATGGAKNVSIQISEVNGNDKSAISFLDGEYHSDYKEITDNGTFTFPFSAQYYTSAGSATVGKVQAKLQYALTYE